ncbi:MAG TPA: hypothetical protein VK152_03505 [Paludibacter sp.]|nr:hypothetical protein [Paludibacter sp.]
MKQVNENKKAQPVGTIKKNKLAKVLLIIIAVLLSGSFALYKIMEYRYNKSIATLKSGYQDRMDSVSTDQMKIAAKTFSWAIRGELIRENKDQVNQFFRNIISEPGISKVEFVDAATSKVSLSTNKKDEGSIYPDQVALMSQETISFQNDSLLTVVTPVMNLNSKIGILVIEYSLKRTGL